MHPPDDCHEAAARHYELAAQHHRAAAEHAADGDHTVAEELTRLANGHAARAGRFALRAAVREGVPRRAITEEIDDD